MGRKRNISIYVCGMVIETSIYEDNTIEKNINERYEKWLGTGNVKFSISRNNVGNEFTLKFMRDWEEQLSSMYQDTLFAGDWQIWFGDSYQDNNCPNCKLSDAMKGRHMLFFDDLEGIKLMYNERAKTLGATKLKEIDLVKRANDQFIVKLKY